MRSTKVRFAIVAVVLGANAPAPPTDLPSALEAGWQGKPVCELLYRTATNRALRCTFPPGVGHERHYHPGHFGYAVNGGRMRIATEQGTREAELKTGASFTSEGVGWHEVLNVGSTPVIYLIYEDWPEVASATKPGAQTLP